MDKTLLVGPNGITLTLDPSEIVPDNPGDGTPALVRWGDQTATYWCALDTGEVGNKTLSNHQHAWLRFQEPLVNKMYDF